MTIWHRIADWISAGALRRARAEAEFYRRQRDDCEAALNDAASAVVEWRESTNKRMRALAAIADMETPGANATVKRMARTAREALE